MSSFVLRLPEDLKEKAAEQAAAAGVSLNQFIAIAVASRVGAQAQAVQYFKARSRRSSTDHAKAILARAGKANPPRSDDAL